MDTQFGAIGNLPYLVVAKDTQSKYLGLSKAFAALLGWESPYQAISKSDYDIPCKASEFAKDFIDTDKKVLSVEKNLMTLDVIFYYSGWKLLLTERTLLKNETQDVIGIVAHCIDVSTTRAYRSYFLMQQIDNKLCESNRSARSYILSDAHCPLSLTEKQQNCLFLLIRGKTLKEIGKILKISPRTAEDHINAIKNKLNCGSKSEVIEKSIDSGFLYYIPISMQHRG